MQCNEIREKISMLLDNELSAEDSAMVTEHLAECPECMRAFEAFHAISVSLEELEDVPEGFTEAVMGRIKTPTPVRKRRTMLSRIAGLAACAALVLLAGTKWIPSYTHTGNYAQDTAKYDQVGQLTPKPVVTPQPRASEIPEDDDVFYITPGDDGMFYITQGASGAMKETTPNDLSPQAFAAAITPTPSPTPVPVPTATPCPVPELIVPEDLLIVAEQADVQLHIDAPDYVVTVKNSRGNSTELSIWLDNGRIYCKDAQTAWYTVGTPEKLKELVEAFELTTVPA